MYPDRPQFLRGRARDGAHLGRQSRYHHRRRRHGRPLRPRACVHGRRRRGRRGARDRDGRRRSRSPCAHRTGQRRPAAQEARRWMALCRSSGGAGARDRARRARCCGGFDPRGTCEHAGRERRLAAARLVRVCPRCPWRGYVAFAARTHAGDRPRVRGADRGGGRRRASRGRCRHLFRLRRRGRRRASRSGDAPTCRTTRSS